MLPAFGGLLFVAFVLLSLSVEVGLLGVAYRDAASITDLAAEAGAAMVDVEALHGGETLVDPDGARAEVRAELSRLGVSLGEASVEVTPYRVCVALSRRHPVKALGYLAVGAVQIEVTGCAEPATG